MLPIEDETPTSQTPSETQGEAPKVNFLTILRNGNFRNLWLGQIISQVGDYFAFLALTVVVAGFSPNAQDTTLAVTGLMLAFTLPRLIFGLLAGVFVDRWDRRRTMLISDILRAGITLLMIPAFMASNLLALFALAFIMSTVSTLFNPAKGALIPNLVSKEHLLAANSLSQTSQMLAVLAGPALAGFTLSVAGRGNEWVAFLVDSASYIVSALAIWLIRISPTLSKPQPGEQSPIRDSQSAIGKVWQELLVGLKALILSRTMATLTIIFSITMLGVGAINVLWVVYLKTRFGFDGPELAWRLSLLDIGFAAGMIVASVIAGNFLSSLAPKWFLVIALLGLGLPIGLFGYLPDYWVIFAVTIFMGAFVAPINTGVTTLMQIVVPNNQLGRVGGGFTTVADAATVASMSLAGFAGSLVGIPMVFALAGLICVVMGIVAWRALPALTLKDKPDDAPVEQSTTTQPEPPLLSLAGIEPAAR